MNEPVKVGFVPASRTIFDQQLAVKVRADVIEAFGRAGLEAVAPQPGLTENGLVQTGEEAEKAARLFADEGVSGVVVGALNFGNEIPAAAAAVKGAPGLPIMVFGIGEEGELTRDASRRDSFCGLISIATALRHREARFVFPRKAILFPDDPAFTDALEEFGRVSRAVKAIRGATYGQVGPRPADFETCAFDELSLMRKFGITVVPVPLSEVFARAAAVDASRATEVHAEMTAEADCSLLEDEDVLKLARLEAVLLDLVREHNLAGLGIQCWTSMQEHFGVSPCFAMARLTDRGIPCACEVDIHGTLSMHLLSLASGSVAGLADWNNRHFREENVFSAWHCGVFPPSMSSGAKRLWCHDILAASTGKREGKFGTVESRLDEGPVTMARVTEHLWEDWPMLLAEGHVVDAPGEPPGSHGWVRVEDLDTLYAEILRGFPHHTAITRGHAGSAMRVVGYFLGLDTVAPLSLIPGHLEIGADMIR